MCRNPRAHGWRQTSCDARERMVTSSGREEVVAFLAAKWARELDYSLRKNLWAFGEKRIAGRFQYESHDAEGQWYRSYGNEQWEFDQHGLMRRREASINDVRIEESQRRIFRPGPGARTGIPSSITASSPNRPTERVLAVQTDTEGCVMREIDQ
jgi:nuclear transport factor 2 (NTF2) superfamily protein